MILGSELRIEKEDDGGEADPERIPTLPHLCVLMQVHCEGKSGLGSARQRS